MKKKLLYGIIGIAFAGGLFSAAYAGPMMPTITLEGNTVVTGDTTLQGDLLCADCIDSDDIADKTITSSDISDGTNLSLIPDIKTETDKIQIVKDDAQTIKYVKLLDQPTNDDAQTFFQISVTCDKNFLVTSLIATVTDPDSTIDIRYDFASVAGPGFGFNQVPTSWKLKHVDLDPSAAASQQGFELLSQMEIEKPIGVAANGLFTILGDVTASTDESDDTIDVGAVVTTSQDAQCSVLVFP